MDNNFAKQIIFSEEARFYLTGFVNMMFDAKFLRYTNAPWFQSRAKAAIPPPNVVQFSLVLHSTLISGKSNKAKIVRL